MSLTLNRNVKITTQPQANSSTTSKFRKAIERFLMLTTAVGAVIVGMLYSDLFSRYINPSVPESAIYGKWIEQEVAPYAREVFVVSERGVTVNGATVATGFEFDGHSFSYRVGSSVRRFEFIGQQHTEMKLDANAYYRPIFRLEGSQGIELR
ncbi:DUF2850 domain-containing protein [Vibrio sp. EA2]|uniref:DUF2850 domain-containing protein n=1 Tax=Vibrio sp. EA2 TaxID=3079860 RepID=UPI0029494A97|nr:DUF2850 domain-containing protein [Vibrio sp. EA2]MDV6251408.1 DUF2850 domain-containing protein [Vibrio sp. EA2]